MENEKTGYYWYKCKRENCGEKFPAQIPAQILANAIESDVDILYFQRCPKCEIENPIQPSDLTEPVSKEDLKTRQLVEKYREKIKFVCYWESELK